MTEFEMGVVMPDASVRIAGDIVLSDPAANGRYESSFIYASDWLADAAAFALDPLSLPLKPDVFNAFKLEPPLGVFQDALPDAWGQKLLFAGLSRSARTDQRLMSLRGRKGLGAIQFIDRSVRAPDAPDEPVAGLEDLVDAALKFAAGETVENPRFRRLLAAGSTPGGARPKALIVDQGQSYIAKFPAPYLDRGLDVVGLEKASLDCAQKAGLCVPSSRLLNAGLHQVLLVERFDITAQGGRRHMISLRTLCKERHDFTVSSYDDCALAIRRSSAAPQDDVDRFYRQTIFNGLLGNTDDHLKNFLMLHDEAGYRLSPAFDLNPDIAGNHEHTLRFNLSRNLECRADALKIGKDWRVKKAPEILEEVIEGLQEFSAFAEQALVSQAQIARFQADISRRVAALGQR